MHHRRGLVPLALVAAAGCATGEAPDAEGADRPGWTLVWADEFDGPAIDPESWTAVVMPDPFNDELQYYTDRRDGEPGANAWIEGGALVIEARREDYGHRRYTSARLNTKGKREFSYGRFEARLRQPGEVGLWPAFWLLGANIDQVGWPRCGEIDVMEGKGRLPRWTSGAIHRGPDPERDSVTWAEYRLEEGSFHDEWHVFAVEWREDRIRWLVDGVEYFSVEERPEDGSLYWPFDEGHPFYLILNLAVGGWFDRPHLPPEDLSPQRLKVDYVRVYRSAGGPGPAPPGADGDGRSTARNAPRPP